MCVCPIKWASEQSQPGLTGPWFGEISDCPSQPHFPTWERGHARSPYLRVLKGRDCLGVKGLSLVNVLILEGRRNT